jgi:hypothetical protein
MVDIKLDCKVNLFAVIFTAKSEIMSIQFGEMLLYAFDGFPVGKWETAGHARVGVFRVRKPTLLVYRYMALIVPIAMGRCTKNFVHVMKVMVYTDQLLVNNRDAVLHKTF